MKVSYERMAELCGLDGGRLALIESAADQRAAEAAMQRVKYHYSALFGIRRKSKDTKVFVNPSGAVVNFT